MLKRHMLKRYAAGIAALSIALLAGEANAVPSAAGRMHTATQHAAAGLPDALVKVAAVQHRTAARAAPARRIGNRTVQVRKVGARAGVARNAGARHTAVKHAGVRHNAVRAGVARHPGVRHVVVVRTWRHRPYYGRVFAGVVIGTIIVATAVAVIPVAPDPTLCWYWSDWSKYNGYWDYCA